MQDVIGATARCPGGAGGRAGSIAPAGIGSGRSVDADDVEDHQQVGVGWESEAGFAGGTERLVGGAR